MMILVSAIGIIVALLLTEVDPVEYDFEVSINSNSQETEFFDSAMELDIVSKEDSSFEDINNKIIIKHADTNESFTIEECESKVRVTKYLSKNGDNYHCIGVIKLKHQGSYLFVNNYSSSIDIIDSEKDFWKTTVFSDDLFKNIYKIIGLALGFIFFFIFLLILFSSILVVMSDESVSFSIIFVELKNILDNMKSWFFGNKN